MNINVHIEQLVLEGLPVGTSQRGMVQASFEAELARLLAARGLAPNLLAGDATPRVPAATIQLTNESHPTRLGQQIAQAVHGGLAR